MNSRNYDRIGTTAAEIGAVLFGVALLTGFAGWRGVYGVTLCASLLLFLVGFAFMVIDSAKS